MADMPRWSDYISKIISLEEAVGHKTNYKILEPFEVTRTPIGIQVAAKRIAKFIGLGNYIFIVAAIKLEGRAAHIELKHGGREVYIEISDSLVRESNEAILTTLAHEICHKYLHHHGLDIKEEYRSYENEILTDICAVYLGLGKLMLNGCQYKTVEYRDKVMQTTKHYIGYLTRKQLAEVYILICSMRHIDQKRSTCNLTMEAQNEVLEITNRYNEIKIDSFNNQDILDFKDKVLRKQILKAQDSLAQVDHMVRRIKDEIIQPVELFLRQSHGTLFELLQDSSNDAEMEYNPALRYLQGLQKYLQSEATLNDLQRLCRASRSKRNLLIKLFDNLSNKENSFASKGAKSKIQCPLDGTVIEIPSSQEKMKKTCPVCGYAFTIVTYLPTNAKRKAKVVKKKVWWKRLFQTIAELCNRVAK